MASNFICDCRREIGHDRFPAFFMAMNMAAKIQVVILTGGQGTRICHLYPELPKALIPVNGRPFLEIQLEWLRKSGIVQQVHLAAGHKACALQEWLRLRAKNINSSPLAQLNITCSIEPGPLGTAGGLKYAVRELNADLFLVLNGDSLLPCLDFKSFLMAHQAAQSLGSLAVTYIKDAGRFGAVEFDGQQRVSAFLEKTERCQAWVNGGVYCLHAEALDMIPDGVPSSLECDFFPKLIQTGRLSAFRTLPPLLDMGTPQGLTATEVYLADSARVNF